MQRQRTAGAVSTILRRAALAATFATGLWAWATIGCSPSYPIPPPSPDVSTFQVTAPSPGRLRIDAANLSPSSRLFVFNRSAGEGSIGVVSASGTVRLELAGGGGDLLEIYGEDSAGNRTESTCPTVNLSGPLLPMTCP